jgi:hypothetical protein
VPQQKTNLVKEGEKYYHSRLYSLPYNPKCYFDDEGEAHFIIDEKKPVQRTMVSAERILAMMVKRLHLPTTTSMKKEIGAIKYLSDEVGLDVLCFAIDACEDDIFDNKISRLEDVFDLRDYLITARERLQVKKAESDYYIKDTTPPSSDTDCSLEDMQKEWLNKLINGNKE